MIRTTAIRSGFNEDRIAQYFDEVVNRLNPEGMDGLTYFLENVCELDSFQTVSI